MIRTLVVIVAAAIGCGSPPPATTGAGSPDRPRTLDRSKVDHVSLLLRGRVTTDTEWTTWRGRSAEDVVGELLGDPFIARTVAPTLIFRNNLLRPSRGLVIHPYQLSTADIGGEPALFLGKPCKAKELVDVRPWWDPAHPVRVCKGDVRAGAWETALASGKIQDCNGGSSSRKRFAGSQCGCGPNLVRCTLPGYGDVLTASAMDEIRGTVAHVVTADEPLAHVFSTNETWRDRHVELLYLRNLVQARRIADPTELFVAAAAWPAEGKLASREELEPGQHAGVLTGPQIVYHVFDPRQRMRIVFEAMWCAGESAPGALPEDLLSLKTANLSSENEGWQELAARPVCTKCHARLDYGMQFFRGFGSIGRPMHYVPDKPGTIGPIYANDIDDPRGTGPLTPRGFAELGTRQPEFARCMAGNVVDYVFGAAATPDQVDRLARSAAPTELRLRPMLRLAALEFLGCDECDAPTRWRRAPATAAAAAPSSLAALVGEHCTDCHHDGASIPSFEGTLDRRIRTRMIDQVLFGRMPPAGMLPWSTRRQFADLLLAPDAAGTQRDNPAGQLRAHANPPRAVPLLVAREQLHQLVGEHAAPGDYNSLETALSGRDSLFTPDYVLLTGNDALAVCARTNDGTTDDCIDRALDLIWGPAAMSVRGDGVGDRDRRAVRLSPVD